MTTMRLPSFSGLAPSSSAAAMAAPEEMPTGRPSSAATSRAVAKALALAMRITPSITLLFEDVGDEAGADALDRMRAGLAAREHGAVLGLDGIDLEVGQARLQHLADAGDGAAGADAGHEDVELAAGIAARSPRPWCGGGSSGLDGFWNCCGMKLSGIVFSSSSARAMAPFMPFSRGVSSSSAPRKLQHLAPLDRHRFRHGQDQPVAFGGGDEGQADAGIARGRLDQGRLARRDAAGLLGGLDHRRGRCDPSPSASGLKNSSLPMISAFTPRLAASFDSRTSGVAPMVSTMLS